MARFRTAMGLDQPLWRQYALFLWRVLHGDFGQSFVFRESTGRIIMERLPATLELAGCAMLLAVGMGIPLGVVAGLLGGPGHGRHLDDQSPIRAERRDPGLPLLLHLLLRAQPAPTLSHL